MLVAGVAAALVAGGGTGHPTTAALPPPSTSTVPGGAASTTSGVPIPEVSLPTKLIAASRLVPFNSCGALLNHARAKALSVVGPYGLPYSGQGGGSVTFGAPQRQSMAATSGQASDSSKSAPPEAAASGAGDGQFSQTNNQEAGVDEPDTVKTDGHRLFNLSGGKLWALSAEGAPRVLGSLALETGSELLLVGNRVIVLGFGGPVAVDGPMMGSAAGPAGPAGPSQAGALATVVDVSNSAAMKITGKLAVDGAYVSARLVDGVARIVLQSQPHGMAFTYPQDNTPAAQAQAAEKNRQAIRTSTLVNWTPSYTVTDAAGRQKAAGGLADCGSSYRPPGFSGFGMLSVITLDADHPDRSNSASVMADGQIVYASATRLYVASNQWGRIVGQSVQPTEQTLIHEFDISSRTAARYKVSGQVRGTVLNQFSMSEDKGVLRVATTDGTPTAPVGEGPSGPTPSGQRSSQSYVTTFGDQGQVLLQLGQVGGLGKGEQIHAVRFLGDLGYVVTFRQMDPLYVVDVSNPAKPVVKGALELLGYSAYLHPIGPGLLLGVGQDATPEGRRAGTQASVFDVTDPAAPKLLQRYTLGGQSNSQVEFDHHAFLWWAPTKLAVLPVQVYDPNGQGGQGFVGAIGLRASSAGISEVGRVQHPQQQQSSGECPPQPQPGPGQGKPSPPCTSRSYSVSPAIERSVVIGSRLFTFSPNGVMASDLTSLAQQAWVPYS
jgi:uncharacterized secreted protein with C-terminal beta-propeller domain